MKHPLKDRVGDISQPLNHLVLNLESELAKQATQADMVLDWLRRHGSITDLDALNHLGVRRLAARIYELRDDHEIGTEREEHNGGWHARYTLEVK